MAGKLAGTAAGTAAVIGVAQLLVSCGDQFSAGPGSDAGDCLSDGGTAAISANHGHTLAVPKEDIIAGSAKTYTTAGTAGHSHTVSLSASDFTSLQSNQGIVVTTDVDLTGHTHSVTLTCA